MQHIALDEHWIDEHWLAVHKPAGLPTHAANPGETGLHEQLCEQYGERLGIHHRLDVPTSGVIVFSRTKIGAKALARAFERREAVKRYLAVTCRKPRHNGTIEHKLRMFNGKARVDKGGKVAKTRIQVLAEGGPWFLVEARPLTGRTHQIRAQLALEGAPILGDTLYGGGNGPGSLMLHAESIELDHPVHGPMRFTAPMDWGCYTDNALDTAALTRSLVDALPVAEGPAEARRLGTPADTGIPGIKIDKYGPGIALRVYQNVDQTVLSQLATAALTLDGVTSAVARRHKEHDSQERIEEAKTRHMGGTPLEGPFTVEEAGVKYEVALDEDLGCGLYLDQRENRIWVRENAAGGEVLNLFAYTCGFSVAAAVGGATRTTSVDVAKKVLERGRRNFELNGLDPKAHRFFDDDAFLALQRAARRGEQYKIVICDPPSFARRKGSVFKLERDLVALAQDCCAVVEPGGTLLFTVNHRGIRLSKLRQAIETAAGGRVLEAVCEIVEDGYAPLGVGTDLKGVRATLA